MVNIKGIILEHDNVRAQNSAKEIEEKIIRIRCPFTLSVLAELNRFFLCFDHKNIS